MTFKYIHFLIHHKNNSLNVETAHSRLLQRVAGLVLLELSELSSRAFSQSGNYFARVVPVVMLLTSVSEKQRTNISTDRSGMAPKPAF